MPFIRSVLNIASLLILIQLAVSSAMAESWVFVDQKGNPLVNAVISSHDVPALHFAQSPVMDQVNKAFVPSVLLVQRGQQVSFPNSDDIRHHVYSFSTPKTFEIRLYKGRDSSPVMFDQPGVVVLGCNIHDQMVGYIYVADQSGAWITGDDGEIAGAAQVNTFSLWHPQLAADKSQRLVLSAADGQVTESGTRRFTVKLLTLQEKTKKRGFKQRFKAREE